MKKKLPLVMSFALAALIVIGQAGFAEESETNKVGNTMNGNMSQMTETMNSPEGKKMINACGDFMESFNEEGKTKDK